MHTRAHAHTHTHKHTHTCIHTDVHAHIQIALNSVCCGTVITHNTQELILHYNDVKMSLEH